METDIRAAFQELNPSEKVQFLSLRDNASAPLTHMSQACAENSFALSSNPPSHGLFLLLSRFNHSCLPNSKVPTTSEEIIASFATRDIFAGEEITFCYNTDFECRTRHERHHALRFICDCKACLIGTPFQQLSDLRRRLVRGLQYLTLGKDLDGETQCSGSLVIVDPKIRKAAQDFSIPLSSRFIYDLLATVLLEEEGLLDDLLAERLNPGILQTVAWFRTEYNARIARKAMAQGTWPERLHVACELYGREDVADDGVAALLRMIQGLRVKS